MLGRLLALLLSGATTFAWAQPAPPATCQHCLVVIGDRCVGPARLELPADQVQLSVQLRYTDPTDARKAYDAHKAAEARLARLLREFQIPDADVLYTLLSVQRNVLSYEPGTGARRQEVATDQRVIIQFNELKRYPALQLALIGAGFDQFTAEFGSTKADDNRQQAIDKAVVVAREKAQIMAKAAGRSLGRVLSVRDTEETDPYFRKRYNGLQLAQEVSAGYGDGQSLFTIPQRIVVLGQVKVTFALD